MLSYVPSSHPTTFSARPRKYIKLWLVAFNFDHFGVPPGHVILFAKNLPTGCGTAYNASRVVCTIWIAPECHQTTHLLFCGAAIECPRNGRKSCYYVRSKSWECLIYYPMSPRGIPRHSVHGSRGCIKQWLAFNFDSFGAPPSPIIIFDENLPMGCGTTYNASQVVCTIWIAPKCHQTTH